MIPERGSRIRLLGPPLPGAEVSVIAVKPRPKGPPSVEVRTDDGLCWAIVEPEWEMAEQGQGVLGL